MNLTLLKEFKIDDLKLESSNGVFIYSFKEHSFKGNTLLEITSNIKSKSLDYCYNMVSKRSKEPRISEEYEKKLYELSFMTINIENVKITK